MIHQPCRCLGGSQVTICRACRCLEASWNGPKSRSIVPVGVWRPPRLLRHGVLTCSGAPQAPPGRPWILLEAFGARKIQIHRPCRCLGGSQITICRACRCLEASRNAMKSRSIVPGGVWRPSRWLLDVFGSSTSSSWRILEALGGFRSLQNQDSSALSVSGRLTNHDLSCLSVSGGLPECFEVTIHRACRCLKASRMVT